MKSGLGFALVCLMAFASGCSSGDDSGKDDAALGGTGGNDAGKGGTGGSNVSKGGAGGAEAGKDGTGGSNAGKGGAGGAGIKVGANLSCDSLTNSTTCRCAEHLGAPIPGLEPVDECTAKSVAGPTPSGSVCCNDDFVCECRGIECRVFLGVCGCNEIFSNQIGDRVQDCSQVLKAGVKCCKSRDASARCDCSEGPCSEGSDEVPNCSVSGASTCPIGKRKVAECKVK